MKTNSNPQPPRFSEYILGWLLKDDWQTPLGDFQEYYNVLRSERGLFHARWWYRAQVIKLLPDRLYQKSYWSAVMLASYFKIALRSISRQKGYAAINVAGLTAGLAVFILMALYVRHELSYDRFHDNAERIYRVVQERPGQSFQGSNLWAITSAPLAKSLADKFPEVETATTLSRPAEMLVGFGEDLLLENGIWADEQFFDVFSFRFINGLRSSALERPGSVVLTTSLAEKLFGDDQAVGKTVAIDDVSLYTVSAVIDDVPTNAHFSFDFILPIASHPDYARHIAEGIRYNNAWFTYLVLTEQSNLEQFNAKLLEFGETHLYSEYLPEEHERVKFHTQALTDIHLGIFKEEKTVNFGIAPGGRPILLYVFSAIGLLVLLLACINYTNLALASSLKRGPEIGVRKALGSRRHQLIGQFLGEPLAVAFIALFFALGLVYFLLPTFGGFVNRELVFSPTEIAYMLPWLLIIVVLVGLLSGAYPAFYMSSLLPTSVLKGNASRTFKTLGLQHYMLLGQYAVSIVLIACGLVIHQQLQYVESKPTGFERAHIVTLPINDDNLVDQYEALRTQWLSQPGIQNVTISSSLPIDTEGFQGISQWDGSQANEERVIYEINADDQFFALYGFELIAGRPFSSARPADSSRAILINEKAAESLGWNPIDAPGRLLSVGADEREVVGVIKNFHLHSLHVPIEPLMIRFSDQAMQFISFKLAPQNLPQTLSLIEQSVAAISPYPFEYQFLDQSYDQLYQSDQQMSGMIQLFTILALLIASLGLFGLAAYIVEQRKKEIGIRKVLGASVGSVTFMLVRDFTRVVLLAAFLAIPIAYLVAKYWLNGFAYRIQIGPSVFIAAASIALAMALLSVIFQTLKAAWTTPAQSIRHA